MKKLLAMDNKISFLKHFILSFIILIPTVLFSQSEVNWLADYQGNVPDLSYSFTTVDGKDCKLNIEEKKTDKKGGVSLTNWVFYLSDLDPSALAFKPSGKLINVSLKTRNSQKFVAESKDGEFSGYVSEIPLTMSEVDKARSFIDVMKTQSVDCRQSDMAWSSGDEAFSWLIENIKPSTSSGTNYDQSFSKGTKDYLAELKTLSTDSKGVQNSMTRVFDLSDINPAGINLVVSGKSLKVDLPVRDKNYYIMERNDNGETSFSRDLEIYTDDIEIARNIVNAFNFLTSNTKAGRSEWTSYSQSMGFVKENLGEVKSSGDVYVQSVDFSDSPSGTVSFKTTTTDSKGKNTEGTSTLFLSDIQSPPTLNVTAKGAYLQIDTKNKNKYIKQMSGDVNESWSQNIKLYFDDIDRARDFAVALDYAINNSTPGDAGLNSTSDVISWLESNVTDITIDGSTIKQSLAVEPDSENALIINIVTPGSSGKPDVSEEFRIYPEDIVTADNVLNVSSKKLYVPISTGKLSYIRASKDNTLQSYSKSVDIIFDDVQKARYFTEAINYLITNTEKNNRELKDKTEAVEFLSSHIKKVETSQVYDQKIEKAEGNECKLKYTTNITDSKGSNTENILEFMVSDIDPKASGISVSSKDVSVNLVTKGKQKLIKPYKNGEVQNFTYSVDIQTDDIVEAKKILGAFKTLADGCLD